MLNNCSLLFFVLFGFLDTWVSCYMQSIINTYPYFPKLHHNCMSLSSPINRTWDTNFGTQRKTFHSRKLEWGNRENMTWSRENQQKAHSWGHSSRQEGFNSARSSDTYIKCLPTVSIQRTARVFTPQIPAPPALTLLYCQGMAACELLHFLWRLWVRSAARWMVNVQGWRPWACAGVPTTTVTKSRSQVRGCVSGQLKHQLNSPWHHRSTYNPYWLHNVNSSSRWSPTTFS